MPGVKPGIFLTRISNDYSDYTDGMWQECAKLRGNLVWDFLCQTVQSIFFVINSSKNFDADFIETAANASSSTEEIYCF